MKSLFLPKQALDRYRKRVFRKASFIASVVLGAGFTGAFLYCDYRIGNELSGSIITALALFVGLLFNLLVLLFGTILSAPQVDHIKQSTGDDPIAIRHHKADRSNHILDSASAIYVSIVVAVPCILALLVSFTLPIKPWEAYGLWAGATYFVGFSALSFFALNLWQVLYYFMLLLFYDEKIIRGG